MAKRLLAAYSGFLSKMPLLGNMLSGGVIMGTGDVLAQSIECTKGRGNRQDIDLIRSSVMSSYSALIFTPYCVLLYGWINRRMPVGGLKNSLMRGTTANLAMNPVVNVLFFFYSTLAEEFLYAENKQNMNTALGKFCGKMENDYLTVCTNSALLWIPFNTVTFWLVPHNFRVVTSSGISVLWSCYLSLVQHHESGIPAASSLAIESESHIGKG